MLELQTNRVLLSRLPEEALEGAQAELYQNVKILHVDMFDFLSRGWVELG
jgi:hypothetical protein